MSKVQRFEDLIAWQKARILTRRIYDLTRQSLFATDFGLAGQIQRAAVSVMSNIAEGFERSGLREFRKFLTVAKSSCAELRSQLYVAFDIGYVNKSSFERILSLSEEVARIVGGLRSSIQSRISNERGQP